jgi:hypothetical protein
MPRCPSRRIYAHVNGKVVNVAFADADVYAQLGDERVRIEHREHARELEAQHGWDGTAVIVPKDGSGEIAATIDSRAAWGHLPRDQATWRINQIAEGADLATVGGVRQLSETLFGGGNKTLGRAAYDAVVAGGGRTVALLSGAILGAGGLDASGVSAEELERLIGKLEGHPSWGMLRTSDSADWTAVGTLLSRVPAEHRLNVLRDLATALPSGVTAAAAAVWAQDDDRLRWICEQAPWGTVHAAVAAAVRRGSDLDGVAATLRARGIVGACLQHANRDAYRTAALIPGLAEKVGDAARIRCQDLIARLEQGKPPDYEADGAGRPYPGITEQYRLSEHLLWTAKLTGGPEARDLLRRAISLYENDAPVASYGYSRERQLGVFTGDGGGEQPVSEAHQISKILAALAEDDPAGTGELLSELARSQNSTIRHIGAVSVAYLHQEPALLREKLLAMVDHGGPVDQMLHELRNLDYTDPSEPHFDPTIHDDPEGRRYEPSLLVNLPETEYYTLLRDALERSSDTSAGEGARERAARLLEVVLESVHVFAHEDPQRYAALAPEIAAVGMRSHLAGMIGPLSRYAPDEAVLVLQELVGSAVPHPASGRSGGQYEQYGPSGGKLGPHEHLVSQGLELFENIPDLLTRLGTAEAGERIGTGGSSARFEETLRTWRRELPAQYAAAHPERATALLDNIGSLPFPSSAEEAAAGALTYVRRGRSINGSACDDTVCTHVRASERYLCARERNERRVGQTLEALLPDLVEQAAVATLEQQPQRTLDYVEVADLAVALVAKRPAQAARTLETAISAGGLWDKSRREYSEALAAMAPDLRPGVLEHLSRVVSSGERDMENLMLLNTVGVKIVDPLPETLIASLQAARSTPEAAEDLARATGGMQLLDLASWFPQDPAALEALDGKSYQIGGADLRTKVIQSLAELRRNAADMNNCTHGYDNDLRRGEVMLALLGEDGRPRYNAHLIPEQGRWVLGEVNLPGNTKNPNLPELVELRALLQAEIATMAPPQPVSQTLKEVPTVNDAPLTQEAQGHVIMG